MTREAGGFDAVVGNPPFAGKITIISANRKNYLPWLQTLHEHAHGNADLVAHFFRRAFSLIRNGGVLGLIATNTIGQGDTRPSGLTWIVLHSGVIIRATRRLKWPGEAAVIVSVVHIAKGGSHRPILDNRPVDRISAYLVRGDLDTSPSQLAASAGRSFNGTKIYGQGFCFDDNDVDATPIARKLEILKSNPSVQPLIKPYIGGEEINNSPSQLSHRFVIDFGDMSLDEAGKFTELIEIVRQKVLPERLKTKDTADGRILKENWWRFFRPKRDLYRAISGFDRTIVIAETAPHMAFVLVNARMIFSHAVKVIAFSTFAPFAVLQSRVHELWARFFSSSMKDDLRYAPSDCFGTFPFPQGFETNRTLEAAGKAYHDYRGRLMIDRQEGLTKTYNRFHARGENAPDIARLRQLHADMDRAVLRAHGWEELAGTAAPEFIEQEADEGKKRKTRLDA